MINRLKKIANRQLSGESGNVFKGMLILLLGSGIGRIFAIISIPILARIYSPDDYGVLALYTSFITVLSPVLTLRYVQAIPLPKSDVMAFNLFALCFQLILFGSLITSIVLLFFSETIFGWFNMQALVPWWWLVVLGGAGTAFYELFTLWSTRKKQYRTIAKTQATQSLIGNLIKIGLGLLAFKPSGLIIGQFLSQSAGITNFVREARSDFKGLLPRVRVKKESFAAKYYQSFMWFRLPSDFLMILSLQAPILISARLYDSNITGQLSFTIMALSLPVSLIGMSISRAYYAEIAKLGKNKIQKIKSLTLDIQKKLFLVAIPIALFVYLFSEWIFVFVFGEKWRIAGQYASLLSPYLLLRFTSSPLDQVFNVISSQLMYLFINIIRFIGFIVIFYVSLKLNLNSGTYVYILSWFMTGHYLFVTFLVIFIINLSLKKK